METDQDDVKKTHNDKIKEIKDELINLKMLVDSDPIIAKNEIDNLIGKLDEIKLK